MNKKYEQEWWVNNKNKNYTWQQAKKKFPYLKANGDADMDGVPNSKDCKPFDPVRHGILSAIGGAISGVFSKEKGAVKQGWQTGMAKPGVVKSIRSRLETRRFERRLDRKYPEQALPSRLAKWGEKMGSQIRTDYPAAYRNIRTDINKARAYRRYIGKRYGESKLAEYAGRVTDSVGRGGRRIIYRTEKGRYIFGGQFGPKGTVTSKPMTYKSRRLVKTKKGEERLRKTVKGESPRGAGRPRATFKPRYHPITGQPVGAMPYQVWYKVRRKILRAYKEKVRTVQEQQRLPEMPPQIPPQMRQQAQISTQLRQIPPQMRQIPPQLIRRPMPQYPQVQRVQYQRPQNIQPMPQQQRFIEVTDIMTGRKTLKPVPQRERWTYQ